MINHHSPEPTPGRSARSFADAETIASALRPAERRLFVSGIPPGKLLRPAAWDGIRSRV
ncbi:MAG: hypothetical protein Q4C27_04590 [Eubacteriales bacterium]|nr:hypothetical protein [Eubacteriales bacterium]